MAFEVIIPKGSAAPLAPYSPATKVGNVVYVSGTVAMDAAGKTVGVGDARLQTRCVLETIRSTLEAAGCSMSDIAFSQIFLKEWSDYAVMNEVYREFFPSNPPARYCVRADLVRPEFLVEIACTAHIGC